MRRTKDIPITIEGRDKGKIFTITEMACSQAERWAARAFLALAKGGVDIPEDIEQAGMAGLAAIGMRAFAGLRWEDVEDLMDEMFMCVSIKTDPQKLPEFTRPLVEEDIDEISTRGYLRVEIFALHTGFSVPAILSQLKSMKDRAGSSKPKTSQDSSPPLSPPA